MSADVAPNQTIYVSNLYEKLKKDETKKSLYAMFSQFGKVLDVVVMKNFRLRGQAWVVFADVTTATNALRMMQGFPFYDKPIKIGYAKSKSDVVAKADGTYVPRNKRDVQERNAQKRDELLKRAEDRKAGIDTTPAASSRDPSAGASMGDEPPHNILFLQNLPAATDNEMLSMLFKQFPGFKEVRLIESRPGIAFVEFGNEMESSVALNGLQGFKISNEFAMKVSYAKK